MREVSLQRSVTASIPGKIMLAGEYAILKGGTSLSAAVDARLHVTVAPTLANAFSIHSDLWPEERELPAEPATEPLLDSLQFLARVHELHGARITVTSDLPISYGLGSSSAVRLASHLAVQAFCEQKIELSQEEIWRAARDAWRLQESQQGFASGYDFVTQVVGGFIEWTANYDSWPGTVRSLDLGWLTDWVHPYGGGVGAPTTRIGGGVRQWLESFLLWPELQRRTSDLIGALLAQNSEAIFASVAAHSNLLRPGPFYPDALYKTLASLPGYGRSWSFKTTGAGGEDAILLLGHRSDLFEADRELRRNAWQALAQPWTEVGSQITWKKGASVD